jgi:hypothetical protein
MEIDFETYEEIIFHLLPLTFLPLPPCVNLLPPKVFLLIPTNQPPKGLTRGGDLREAQVDVPSSV